MLTSKYLPEYYEVMVSLLNVGVNLGSSLALYFSTLIYFNAGRSLALPLVIYAMLNFILLLPISACCIK